MSEIVERKTEKGEVIYRIDKKKKKGFYYIRESDTNTHEVVSPIMLDGFEKLPSGFYKNGYGLTLAGNLLIREISVKYKKKVQLTVTAKKHAEIHGRGQAVKLTLPHHDLAQLGHTIRTIKRERNAEMRLRAQHFLGTLFIQFKNLKSAEADYTPGKLAEVLSANEIVGKFSIEDREALETLIPEYLSGIPGTLRAKKKLQVIYDALDAGKRIYLEKVLKEFRVKLRRRVQNEQIWQEFLSEYILVLQHNYGEVLEKESVSLQGKFPDFMLVDPYGYLDIYEIKKPTTELMRLDASRNNYYWDTELAKAVAQVENYIHQIQRHADALTNDIKKAKGIEVNTAVQLGLTGKGERNVGTKIAFARIPDREEFSE